MDNVIIYDKLEELNEGIEYNWGVLKPFWEKVLSRACKEVF